MCKFAEYVNKKLATVPYYVLKYNIGKQTDAKFTRKELMEHIYQYEMKNLKHLINHGIDKHTGEIGYFIQS